MGQFFGGESNGWDLKEILNTHLLSRSVILSYNVSVESKLTSNYDLLLYNYLKNPVHILPACWMMNFGLWGTLLLLL